MFVTRRRFEQAEAARDFEKVRANANLELWMEQFKEAKGLSKELSITDASLTAAESALDEKERTIERLQDDLYRMYDHLMYVREVMTDLP